MSYNGYMATTHTRTYTRYFDEEDVNRLKGQVVLMKMDFDKREPNMTKAQAHAHKRRLLALTAAIELADEPVHPYDI